MDQLGADLAAGMGGRLPSPTAAPKQFADPTTALPTTSIMSTATSTASTVPALSASVPPMAAPVLAPMPVPDPQPAARATNARPIRLHWHLGGWPQSGPGLRVPLLRCQLAQLHQWVRSCPLLCRLPLPCSCLVALTWHSGASLYCCAGSVPYNTHYPIPAATVFPACMWSPASAPSPAALQCAL